MAMCRLNRPPDRRQKAGLEGALLAAGLLSAVIQPDGTVVAADGELLLSPDSPPGPRPARPLSIASEAVSEPMNYGFVERNTTSDGTGIPGGVGGGLGYDGPVIFYVGVPDVEAAL